MGICLRDLFYRNLSEGPALWESVRGTCSIGICQRDLLYGNLSEGPAL